LVGVDFDQAETPAVLGLDLFQQGADDFARAAPRRPKIHQNRQAVRGFDDIGFEILGGDVDHLGRFWVKSKIRR
jgi:hypothetical protein